jgi:hypothetical protein
VEVNSTFSDRTVQKLKAGQRQRIHICIDFVDMCSYCRYVRESERLLQSFQLKTALQYYQLSEGAAGIGINGTNVYGILRAPRGDATEAIVLSASWKTSDGRVDVGGVALLMSLAGYFKRTVFQCFYSE